MIKIDKKTLLEFQEAGVKKIHVFFYEAGCSGTKVDIETDFDEKELELVAVFPELDEDGKPKPHPNPLLGEERGQKLPISSKGEGTQGGGFNYENGIKVFIKSQDKEKFDGAMVTKIREKSDNPHLQGKKEKYIFSNPKIQDRCGCGTSFSFEKRVPKIDLDKLRFLKDRFGK